MNRKLLFIAMTACLALAVACPAQEDPFGGPAPPAGAPPAAAAKKAGKTVIPDEPVRQPLVIELLRSRNPTTPQQLLQAAQIAFQYGRPDEAKVYLAKLAASTPADEALASLAAPNADFLVQLSSSEALQPEGRQVAGLVLAAADKLRQNPESIADAIKQLSTTDPAARQQAFRTLAAAGSAAVNPLLKALVDQTRTAEHPQLRAALVGLASVSELPLIAVLQSSDRNLQMQAVAMLGRLQSHRAAPFLIRPALDPKGSAELRELAAAALKRILGSTPDLTAADSYLRREIEQWLNGQAALERDVLSQVQLWQWDDKTQQATAISLPARDAALALAARAASDLFALKPLDPSAQRLMLLTNLELAKIVAGLNEPLPTGPLTPAVAALAAGPATVSQVLSDALARHRLGAAIAACEVLGKAGDASVLHATTGLSPLAQAMRSSDSRVRIAAALAAVTLDPGGAFPGSGLVAPTLARYIKTSGHPAVLIGDPRGEEAQSLVAHLGPLGYEGDSVTSGRLVAERLKESPDFDFLLVSDAIDTPPVEELVQWLRRDFRTARLPIGVMSASERLDALGETFKKDSFTAVFPRIYSPEVAARSIALLQAIAGRSALGADERISQAQQALAALKVLAKSDETIARYDLLGQEAAIVAALHHPALSDGAANLLGRLGTPTAQAALLDFASQSTRSLAQRQAAAAAFAAGVKQRGLRLTQAQVLQQYDRYNASAALDQPTQTLMGGILDTIERQAAASN